MGLALDGSVPARLTRDPSKAHVRWPGSTAIYRPPRARHPRPPLPRLQLSLAVAFAALLCLELLRAAAPPLLLPARLRAALHGFMAHFVDARDLGGPLFVTHLALLLGCAAPLWLGCAMPEGPLRALQQPLGPVPAGLSRWEAAQQGHGAGGGVRGSAGPPAAAWPWLLVAAAGACVVACMCAGAMSKRSKCHPCHVRLPCGCVGAA